MRNRRGFTLIEILVVVAIIALLISILLPSLARARAETRSVVCRSGMKQLMYGQLLYAQDYKRLPATISTFYESGCAQPSLTLDEQKRRKHLFTWEGAYTASSVNKKTLIPRKGTIYRYLNNDALYVCPDDKPGGPLPIPAGGGGNGFLSYSMNAFLGWKSPDFKSFRFVVDESGNDPDNELRRYRAGQSVVYNASTVPVLLEEHPKYNMNNHDGGSAYGSGYGEGNFNFTDRIATRHSPGLGGADEADKFSTVKGRTNIAYLDGHAEAKLYSWHTTGDQLFLEYGQPARMGANIDAFMTLCPSNQCPK